jgi:signal transduction histidine kinase
MGKIGSYLAWAVVPVLEGEELRGVVAFAFSEAQDFERDCKTFIQMIVIECSQAIFKLILMEEQRLYAKKAIELQSITSDLSKALTEEQVLEVIRNRVFQAVDGCFGMFFAPLLASEEFKVVAWSGFSEETVLKLERHPSNIHFLIHDSLARSEPIFIASQSELLGRNESIAIFPMILNQRKLGAILWVCKTAGPFSASNQRLMRTLVVHCAEALERARLYDLSEKAVRSRDTLISVSAHELLTPVAGSKLQMQLLRKRMAEGQEITQAMVRKMVDQTERQLDRLNRLVNEMLDLSRINLGKLTLRRTRTNLSELVSDLIERMGPQLQSSGCTVGSTVLAEIESRIEGQLDSYRIEQVLSNLVSNACRYGRGKPVQIRLQRKPKNQALLEVRDQGIGIKKEDQERIFQRFERVASMDEGGGLGLGLFVVKQIVEAHGGAVTLESDFGHGSSFSVHLPLNEVA